VRLAIVQKGGQITIPVDLRQKLGIEKGGVVALTETEEGILLSPRRVLAVDALDRIGAVLKEQEITLDELIESGRDIRGEIVQREYGLDAESQE
jgi:AbrB family looped-hinge helix DNA binding protein